MELTGHNIILIVYIVLLMAGGLVGFLKAGSKASLIASSAFTVALAVTEFAFQNATASNVLLLVLLIFFGMRLAKGRKFMPAGMMVLMTIVVLLLRLII